MAILPLSHLSNYKWRPWKWKVHRMDESSGSGDGRYWFAELAAPLWKADLVLENTLNTEAARISAAINYSIQTRQPFLLTNPVFCKPNHEINSGSTIRIQDYSPKVLSVGTDRMFLTIKDLPPDYLLTAGDKFHITIGSTRYFGEVSLTTEVGSGGSAVNVPVFPPLPFAVGAEQPVTFYRPACPVRVQPGSFVEGDIQGNMTSGLSFTAIQRK